MSTRYQLQRVALACEAATQGSWDLDRQIAQALGEPYGAQDVSSGGISYDVYMEKAARYTTNLNVSKQLIPKGWRLNVLGEWDDEQLRAKGAWQAILVQAGKADSFGSVWGNARCDHAHTAELALITAVLRARARLVE